MACAEFEDRLLDYGELPPAEREAVEAHVAGCAECRRVLALSLELDARLTETYSGARLSPQFEMRLLARVSRPSRVPEVLDLIGWAAVLALAGLLAPLVPPVSGNVALEVAAGIAVLAAGWTGVRSYSELKR